MPCDASPPHQGPLLPERRARLAALAQVIERFGSLFRAAQNGAVPPNPHGDPAWAEVTPRLLELAREVLRQDQRIALLAPTPAQVSLLARLGLGRWCSLVCSRLAVSPSEAERCVEPQCFAGKVREAALELLVPASFLGDLFDPPGVRDLDRELLAVLESPGESEVRRGAARELLVQRHQRVLLEGCARGVKRLAPERPELGHEEKSDVLATGFQAIFRRLEGGSKLFERQGRGALAGYIHRVGMRLAGQVVRDREMRLTKRKSRPKKAAQGTAKGAAAGDPPPGAPEGPAPAAPSKLTPRFLPLEDEERPLSPALACLQARNDSEWRLALLVFVEALWGHVSGAVDRVHGRLRDAQNGVPSDEPLAPVKKSQLWLFEACFLRGLSPEAILRGAVPGATDGKASLPVLRTRISRLLDDLAELGASLYGTVRLEALLHGVDARLEGLADIARLQSKPRDTFTRLIRVALEDLRQHLCLSSGGASTRPEAGQTN